MDNKSGPGEGIEDRQNAELYRRQNGHQLSTLMANLPGMTYLCQNDENWTMEFVSEGCFGLTGYAPEDLIGNRTLSYNDLIHPDDQLQVWVQIQEALSEKRLFQMVYRIQMASGVEKWVWEQGMGVFSDKGELLALAGFISDIINHKLVEEVESRFAAFLELNRMQDSSLQDLAEFALEEALRLTRSEVGYLAFLNEDQTILSMHGFSKIALRQCAIPDKQTLFPVEKTGLWGEAVRQRKPVITNNYELPNPLKKGYPKGHVKIVRHMNIPVFDHDRIVAVLGVGNKQDNYDESDVRQLTLLMQGMWRLIFRSKKNREL